MSALSDNDRSAKYQRPRLDEITPATKSAATRDASLNRHETYWFEPQSHPGMNSFWAFPK